MNGRLRRILHFAQDSDTSGFFPQLARWHDRERYRMYFGTLNATAPWLRDFMESESVQVFSCECRSRFDYPMGVARLVRFLRHARIDILHVHLFDPSVVGLTAGILAGVPVRVMTRHYSDYHTRLDRRWHVRLDRMCTAMSTGVIAVSEHTAEHMISEEAAPPTKLRVIVNGIDFDRVRLSAPDAALRLRHELGVEHGYLVLVAARLHPEKGYEHLFRAVASLKERLDKPLVLAVAGTGPLQAMYEAQVRELGCADAVRFLGFRKDLPDLMTAADVFVLPSVAEAFGLVLTEALYLGTPVVATRVGGIPEIVAHGVDGVLVPPGDSASLADAIARMLCDREQRRRLAGAGREKVIRRFQFRDMVRSYEQYYADLFANRERYES